MEVILSRPQCVTNDYGLIMFHRTAAIYTFRDPQNIGVFRNI